MSDDDGEREIREAIIAGGFRTRASDTNDLANGLCALLRVLRRELRGGESGTHVPEGWRVAKMYGPGGSMICGWHDGYYLYQQDKPDVGPLSTLSDAIAAARGAQR